MPLKQLTADSNEIHSDHNENEAEMSDNHLNDEGVDEEFFEDIKTVREMITVLSRNNHKINELRGKYAKAIKSGQEKTISE